MPTRYLAPTIVALALIPALAHEPSPPQVSRERLRADLEFLTSPPLEGRASLTRGADAAARFLANELRKAGVEPGNRDAYLQRLDLAPVSRCTPTPGRRPGTPSSTAPPRCWW